jgi:hypothetical protein
MAKRLGLWLLAIAIAATLLVLTGYTSRDADSTVYAKVSSELARRPLDRWIAPEWWGAWGNEGPFREHPVGIFLLPAFLIRAGFPSDQAPYVVNMLYQMGVILLVPLVAVVFVKDVEARALAWLLQLLPVAFTYRIRANQEPATLMCLLILLYATSRAQRHAGWIALMVASFCFLVLIKGVFAIFALAGAALWILLAPPEGERPAAGAVRPWLGLVASIGAAAIMMLVYEALYRNATGDSFLTFYHSQRLSSGVSFNRTGVVRQTLINAWWYVTRLLWFPFPWSLFTLPAVWIACRPRTAIHGAATMDAAARRGTMWAAAFALVQIAVLSPGIVRAERFVFPAYYAIGAVGAVAAIRTRARMARVARAVDAYAWAPVAVWLVTFLLSLTARFMRSA